MISVTQNCTEPRQLKNGKIVACGQCILCRAKKGAEWALRSRHQLITDKGKATFITMTYKTKHLTKTGFKNYPIKRMNEYDVGSNLNKEDFQKFFKRLRKYIDKHLQGRKVKIIYCGEYGGKKWRAHGHAIIFNLEPHEIPKEKWLELWGKGIIDIDGDKATEHAVQYVVGYVRKKMLNKESKVEYRKNGRNPPFIQYSNGIGKDWALKNVNSWINTLKLANNGYEQNVPRYYINLVKKSEGKVIQWDKYYYDDCSIKEKWDKNNPLAPSKLISFKYDRFIECEKRYTLIENLEGENTFKINYQLMRQKRDKNEDYLKNKELLKSEEYFDIARLLKEDEDLDLVFYKKKCENYIKYYNNESAFKRHKWIQCATKIQDYINNHIDDERLKVNKYQIYQSMFMTKAKIKEHKIKNGLFGSRSKDEQ